MKKNKNTKAKGVSSTNKKSVSKTTTAGVQRVQFSTLAKRKQQQQNTYINFEEIDNDILEIASRSQRKIFRKNVLYVILMYLVMIGIYTFIAYHLTMAQRQYGKETTGSYFLTSNYIKVGFILFKLFLLFHIISTKINVVKMIGCGGGGGGSNNNNNKSKLYRVFTTYISTGIWYYAATIGFYSVQILFLILDITLYAIIYFMYIRFYLFFLILLTDLIFLMEYSLSLKFIASRGIIQNVRKTLFTNSKNITLTKNRRTKSSGSVIQT